MGKISAMEIKHKEIPNEFKQFVKYIQNIKVGEKKTIKQIIEENPTIDPTEIQQFLLSQNPLKNKQLMKINQSCYQMKERNIKTTNTINKSKTPKIKQHELNALIQMAEFAINNSISIYNDSLKEMHNLKSQLESIKRQLQKRI